MHANTRLAPTEAPTQASPAPIESPASEQGVWKVLGSDGPIVTAGLGRNRQFANNDKVDLDGMHEPCATEPPPLRACLTFVCVRACVDRSYWRRLPQGCRLRICGIAVSSTRRRSLAVRHMG